MVRRETDEETNDLQDMSDASERKETRKWAVEKPKLDNARNLSDTNLIDPDDEEFKDIMKNARRKLEVPMPAATPAKFNLGSTGRPVAVRKIVRPNTLALLRPTNLQGSAWKDLFTSIMKIILQEKERIY